MFTDINPDDCATDKDLECNIIDDTSGDLKRILVSAVQVSPTIYEIIKIIRVFFICLWLQ